jgi:hypothetical protein
MAIRSMADFRRAAVRTVTWVVLLMAGGVACAGPEPILRSNDRLLLYGKELAAQEIEACRAKAERTGLQHGTNRSGNAAGGATVGAIGGAAVGASAGLVGGATGVGIGAGAGAVVGGLLGMIAGAYKPLNPDPQFTAFVERCLREKGYDVSGWQ